MNPIHWLSLIAVILIIAVPVSAAQVNVTWNASQPSPLLNWTTIDGQTKVTPPDFNVTAPWKNIGRVNKSDQVMVYYPKFWYYTTYNGTSNSFTYSISDVNVTSPQYKVHPAFISDGHELNAVYLGAYEAAVQYTNLSYNAGDFAGVDTAAVTGDMLASYPGLKPASGQNNSLTLPVFRTLAQNRNRGASYNQSQGWQLMTFQQVSAVEDLYIDEYANWNSQATIGAGVTNLASGTGNQAVNTGSTSALGNATGNASVMHSSGVWTYPINMRGLENVWGNMLEWIDGINIKADRNPWVSDHDFASDIFTSPYIDTGLVLPNANGYIKNLSYTASTDWAFFPSSTTGGSSSTYIPDVYSQAAGNTAALFGGGWYYTTESGAYYWNYNTAPSGVSKVVGARISYIPIPVAASFTANITSGNTPLAVQFTNTSSGDHSSYLWDFGDSTTSVSANPEHTYSTCGSYLVNLTVSGDGGTNTSTGQFINVTQLTTFVPVGPIPVWEMKTFAFNSTTNCSLIMTYLWNMGDGTTYSTQNVTHVYGANGNYTVSLTTTSAYGSSSNQTFVDITTFTFAQNKTAGYPPLPVNFSYTPTNVTPTSFEWSYNNLTTPWVVFSIAQESELLLNASGNYSIRLNATSLYSNASTTKWVNVSPLYASFVSNVTEGLVPLAIQFTDTSPGVVTSWDWNFGDGSPNSTLQNPNHTYVNSATYKVTLIVSNGLTKASVTSTIDAWSQWKPSLNVIALALQYIIYFIPVLISILGIYLLLYALRHMGEPNTNLILWFGVTTFVSGVIIIVIMVYTIYIVGGTLESMIHW